MLNPHGHKYQVQYTVYNIRIYKSVKNQLLYRYYILKYEYSSALWERSLRDFIRQSTLKLCYIRVYYHTRLVRRTYRIHRIIGSAIALLHNNINRNSSSRRQNEFILKLTTLT